MIVKFSKAGSSFKGLALYLGHDPDHATTSDRVAWTHTLNLAHDHIESAVDEMFTVCLMADHLKAEAGIRLGRQTEKPVKHVSLNWAPSERPSREEMIEAAKSLLKHMGWEEHQTILFAHDDKEHRHVHLVVNAVHPETGLKLDDGLEWRRAQKWALAYEQERGHVFCEQRQRPAAEREASVPRPAWMMMKEDTRREIEAEQARMIDPSYLAREENRLVMDRAEWQIIKAIQRDERVSFIAGGKKVYGDLNRAVYRDVREEFRPEWADFYAAGRAGRDAIEHQEIKAGLIARQKHADEERREAAAAELRKQRDIEYRTLLERQKDERGELVGRQEQGLRSPHLLDRAYPSPERGRPSAQPRREGTATAPKEIDALERFGIRRGRVGQDGPQPDRRSPADQQRAARQEPLVPASSPEPRIAPSRDLASGLAGGFLALIGGLAESFIGGHTAKPPPAVPPKEVDPLQRFGIRRGQPPPEQEKERMQRQKADDEAYWAWREDRDKDR